MISATARANARGGSYARTIRPTSIRTSTPRSAAAFRSSCRPRPCDPATTAGEPKVAAVDFLFLDRPTVESLLPDTRTLLDIIAGGLAAHGRGEVVLPAKSHLHLDDRFNGHFNILPGYVAAANVAGI